MTVQGDAHLVTTPSSNLHFPTKVLNRAEDEILSLSQLDWNSYCFLNSYRTEANFLSFSVRGHLVNREIPCKASNL